MAIKNATERIFGSRIRAKLLGWFFTHEEERFFVRRIASILGEDPTNLSREMAKLEELGILESKREGKLKQFSVNHHCSFFKEMKGLVLKTVGVAGRIKEALERLPGIELAFIYGSYARGKETAISDVDLMIVGGVDMDRLDTVLRELENDLGREINYLLYSKSEFKAKRKKKDGFVMDVLSDEKMILIGTESEFAAP
jgi:predicted nucleotidyltransferase